MLVRLAYGKTHQEVEIPDDRVKAILRGQDPEPAVDGLEMVRSCLKKPIGSERLRDIVRKRRPRKVVVIVNDITRPTPYREMLPPLLEEIEEGGADRGAITLVVATGIHRGHTHEDNLYVFGREICDSYRIVNHDCDKHLVSLGYLANGWELEVNREVAEADLLIATGLVGLHYFAGYSGGRKSVLPGVASRSLISRSHAMMTDPRACLGNYEDNPVHLVMTEAANRVGVDFILNVVATPDKRIELAVAGDMEKAWLEAVRFCEAARMVELDEPAEIVIAGCGGYPKDINLYQAQKALDAAAPAVKDGGAVILVAECTEGLGEAVFERWLDEASSPADVMERFSREFELGGHKAFAICRLLERMRVILVSRMPAWKAEKAFLIPAGSLEEAWHLAIDGHRGDFKTIIIPEAANLGIKIKRRERA